MTTPFTVTLPPVRIASAIETADAVGLGDGVAVGVVTGLGVGIGDGVRLGTALGLGLGFGLGFGLGLGFALGLGLGNAEGFGVGDGARLGVDEGDGFGLVEGLGLGLGLGLAPGAGRAGAPRFSGAGAGLIAQSVALSFVSRTLPREPPGPRSMLDPAGGAGAGPVSTKAFVAVPQPTASIGVPPVGRRTSAPPVPAIPAV